MKIIQYIVPGLDCPEELAGDLKFTQQIIDVTFKRLQLRTQDEVKVVFTSEQQEDPKSIAILNKIIEEQAKKIRSLKDQILYVETVCSEEGSYKP